MKAFEKKTSSHCKGKKTSLNCMIQLGVCHTGKPEKPLTPWVVAEEDGKIIAAHCDCMARLGESCSHVASLLFAIESGVHIRDSMTVTKESILGHAHRCERSSKQFNASFLSLCAHTICRIYTISFTCIIHLKYIQGILVTHTSV